MCLILFGLDAHPDYPLILAANRDEFRHRETQPLHRWPDRPTRFGGRDVRAGGTWMGVRMDGRFAALTNIRDFTRPDPPNAPSRGDLVSSALDAADPIAYLRAVPRERYAGFNLLAGSWKPTHGLALHVISNADTAPPTRIEPGVHGLSNATLDVPWPKVSSGCDGLMPIISSAQCGAETSTLSDLFALVSGDTIAPDDALPKTGVPLALERRLSARFIRGQDYGTRSQAALLMRRDGRVWFCERTIRPGAAPTIRSVQFDVAMAPGRGSTIRPAEPPVHRTVTA